MRKRNKGKKEWIIERISAWRMEERLQKAKDEKK